MSPRRRSGKKIDFVHWTMGKISANNFGATATAAGTLIAALHEPETLLRMRGFWTTHLRSTLAPGVAAFMGCGIILVPEGTGTTVLWSPLIDHDAPWIWYDMTVITYEEPVANVTTLGTGAYYRSLIDNKAMRIVRNQEIQVVFESIQEGGAGNTDNTCAVRILSGT